MNDSRSNIELRWLLYIPSEMSAGNGPDGCDWYLIYTCFMWFHRKHAIPGVRGNCELVVN